MKIQRYETGIVSLPREEGPLSGGMGSKAEFITIKIITDDGYWIGGFLSIRFMGFLVNSPGSGLE